MMTTQKAGDLQKTGPGIPSNYSRLIARELDLTAKQLPRLLLGTGLGVAQLLSEESLPAMMIIFIVLIISFLTLLLLPSVRRQFLTD